MKKAQNYSLCGVHWTPRCSRSNPTGECESRRVVEGPLHRSTDSSPGNQGVRCFFSACYHVVKNVTQSHILTFSLLVLIYFDVIEFGRYVLVPPCPWSSPPVFSDPVSGGHSRHLHSNPGGVGGRAGVGSLAASTRLGVTSLYLVCGMAWRVYESRIHDFPQEGTVRQQDSLAQAEQAAA